MHEGHLKEKTEDLKVYIIMDGFYSFCYLQIAYTNTIQQTKMTVLFQPSWIKGVQQKKKQKKLSFYLKTIKTKWSGDEKPKYENAIVRNKKMNHLRWSYNKWISHPNRKLHRIWYVRFKSMSWLKCNSTSGWTQF